METVTLYDGNNAVIIVNKADVDKYKSIGFSTKKNEPKKKAETAKTEPKKEEKTSDKASASEEEKKTVSKK